MRFTCSKRLILCSHEGLSLHLGGFSLHLGRAMFHESVPITGLPLTRLRSVFLAMTCRAGTQEWYVFSLMASLFAAQYRYRCF